jgi:hypothetical protein
MNLSGDPDMQRPKRHNNLIYIAISFAMTALLAIAPQANAAGVSHGEMAAAIRSANYPCAHVLRLESAGENAWSVECNSGKFRVSRDQDGNFTVSQTD